MPRRDLSAASSFPQRLPSTSTSPEVGSSSPSRISTVVVLPAPLGPSSPKVSPRAISRSSPLTASTVPLRLLYRFRRSRHWTAGVCFALPATARHYSRRLGGLVMGNRREKDSLGEMEVPEEAYYGAQTARALENYPISGMRVHTALVESYVLLKKAAAESLMELEMLDAERGQAIVQAAGEVLAGALRDQFVVDAFHSGAGTSLHMNVNEVLAGRANEVLTGRRGGSSPVHPNDHVNMSQSTNDTFPTALRM